MVLTIYENKIDIANCRQDMSSIDYDSFSRSLDAMTTNVNLTDVINDYGRAIQYFDQAEEMNISPEYREYLTKYKEAIIKERDGINQYQLAMGNKYALLLVKRRISLYISAIDEASENYRTVGITMNEREARKYNDIIQKANNAIIGGPLESLKHDSSGFFKIEYNREEKKNEVIYPQVGPRKSGAQVYSEVLNREKEINNNIILSEKYLNEAKILFEEAEKIKPK